MKIPKLLSLVALVVLIQPSFACGCGDSSIQPLLMMLQIVLLVSYLMPSAYFLFCIRNTKLSLWVLIISHSLMMTQALFDGLGMYYLLRPFMGYISNNVLSNIDTLILILIWLFPAIYAYLKVKAKPKLAINEELSG